MVKVKNKVKQKRITKKDIDYEIYTDIMNSLSGQVSPYTKSKIRKMLIKRFKLNTIAKYNKI